MTLKTINWIGGVSCSLLLAFIFAICLGTSQAGAADKPTDKQKIELLEQQVVALQADLAGEHEWATAVNAQMEQLGDRTLNLHQRLIRVENRGPVAGVR